MNYYGLAAKESFKAVGEKSRLKYFMKGQSKSLKVGAEKDLGEGGEGGGDAQVVNKNSAAREIAQVHLDRQPWMFASDGLGTFHVGMKVQSPGDKKFERNIQMFPETSFGDLVYLTFALFLNFKTSLFTAAGVATGKENS